MKTRRILSALLTVAVLLSTFVFALPVAAEGETVLYVSDSGSADGDGSQARPYKDITAAITKLASTGGTIKIVGTYTASGATWPSNAKRITIEGADGTASTITTVDGNGPFLGGEIEFRNITFARGINGHWNTKGNKIVFGDGIDTSALIHVGPMNGKTASEYVVLDGGARVTGNMTIGGSYSSDSSNGITGNVYVDVLDGYLSKLNLNQDGYTDSMKSITIGGDVKVKVGANGEIADMNDSDRPAIVKGYFHLIVENGGNMCAYDLTNFAHKDVYRVNVTNPANGTVNNTDKTGVFEIVPNNGYVAKVTDSTGAIVGYYGANAKATFSLGTMTVTFVEGEMGGKTVDLTINAPTPGESDFPVSIAQNDQYDIAVTAHTPNDTTVVYSTEYTYTIRISGKGNYKVPADISVATINGSNEFRISGWTTGDNYVEFKYIVAKTADDPTRILISYDGGYGTISQSPVRDFYFEPAAGGNRSYTIEDPGYTKGGYTFKGFSIEGKNTYEEGMTLYQPEQVFTVPDPVEGGNNKITFTAVWAPLEKFVVTFSGNGSSGDAPASIYAYENDVITLPENTFTKLGNNFKAWKNGSTEYAPGATFTVAGNASFEAVWEADPNTGNIYYVDAVNGDPDNDGTLANPFNSLATAIEKADDNDNVTIVILGSLTLSEIPAHADGKQVTIVGNDANSTLILNGTVAFSNDTTIKNIKINAKNDGNGFITNGYASVFGPNLENVGKKYDIYDGGNAPIEKIQTTIESGVTIGNYYLGGENGCTVSGNINLAVNGGKIDTLNLAPKAGQIKSNTNSYVFVNIGGGEIGNIKMSKKFASKTKAFILAFSNGTIPADAATSLKSVLDNMVASKDSKAILIDSGVGGRLTGAVKAGSVKAAADNGNIWYGTGTLKDLGKSEGTVGASKMTGITSSSYPINKIRYGAPYSNPVAITIGNPVGGAETFSIKPQTDNTDVTVTLDGWKPELAENGGKQYFKYETKYTVDVRIALNGGKFFNDGFNSVTINGAAATVTLNGDGTLTASYNGFEETSLAPLLTVKFDGDGATGTVPSDMQWEHMGTQNLPNGFGMEKLGYYFRGWKNDDPNDGKLYGAGEAYTYTYGKDTVTFTAVWGVRGDWELPQVVLLYDLTAYASDTGRNPKFENSDSPILVDGAFDALEKAIGGTQQVGKGEMDHVKGWKLESDGSSETMMFNSYRFNTIKIDPNEYKHVTIVYYYDSNSGAAIGQYGEMTFGNLQLSDGSTSSWYGKGVVSKEKVVANKWSTVTFDLTEALSAVDVPDGSIYRQFHIWPIGKKTCKEMSGDTLYLKALYMSKKPTVK